MGAGDLTIAIASEFKERIHSRDWETLRTLRERYNSGRPCAEHLSIGRSTHVMNLLVGEGVFERRHCAQSSAAKTKYEYRRTDSESEHRANILENTNAGKNGHNT